MAKFKPYRTVLFAYWYGLVRNVPNVPYRTFPYWYV